MILAFQYLLLQQRRRHLCAGQDPFRDQYVQPLAAGLKVHLIGGAKEAAELDAQRAIAESWKLSLMDLR